MATFSLTRGALLAASTAAWLLAAEDGPTRQAHGMAYADHMLERREEWHSEIRAAEGVHWRRLALVQRHMALRRHGLRVYATGRRALRMPSPTALVRAAAVTVFPDDPPTAAELRAQWRATSSDAHGLMWGALTRSAVRAGPSGGLQEFAVGGDLPSIAGHFRAAFLVTRWAWLRHEHLSRAHLP